MSVVITHPPKVAGDVVGSFAPDGVVQATMTREAKEAATRARLKNGELGLDVYGMRDELARRGLTYRAAGA